MSTIAAFTKRHPVLSYYLLVFTISWGGILVVVGPGGYPGTAAQVETLALPVLLALFAGPSLSGLLLTGIVDGRPGFRELVSRLLQWRVGARWYAFALLTGPALETVLLLVFSLVSPAFLPRIYTTDNKAFVLGFGIAWALIGGGLLEELGWTGFAVPRLRRRYDVLTTGLLVGLLWAAWHLLVTLWMSGTPDGTLSLDIFLPGMLFYWASLPAYRVLLVWVHDRTQSLPVVMLMHASLSACTMILEPLGLALMPGLIYELVLASALWVIPAVIVLKQFPGQASAHRAVHA